MHIPPSMDLRRRVRWVQVRSGSAGSESWSWNRTGRIHLFEAFVSVEKCACKAFSFISSLNVNQDYGLLKRKGAKTMALFPRGGAAGRAWGQRQSSPPRESWGRKEPCGPTSCSRWFAGCVEGSRRCRHRQDGTGCSVGCLTRR